jgi:hypothetical protein
MRKKSIEPEIRANEIEQQVPGVSSRTEVIQEAIHTLYASRVRLHAHGLSMYHA